MFTRPKSLKPIMTKWLLYLLMALPAVAQSPSDYIQRVTQASFPRGVTATGSMLPAFDERFYLLVLSPDEYPFSQVRSNDIILYWGLIDGKVTLICHAVLSVSSNHSVVVCKGYNNLRPDTGLIYANQYAGFVAGWVRRDLVFKSKTSQPVRFELDSAGRGIR